VCWPAGGGDQHPPPTTAPDQLTSFAETVLGILRRAITGPLNQAGFILSKVRRGLERAGLAGPPKENEGLGTRPASFSARYARFTEVIKRKT